MSMTEQIAPKEQSAQSEANTAARRSRRLPPSTLIMAAGLLFLAIVPPLAYFTGNEFWLSIFTRLTILSIAAVSLNLVLGYGGLVSFGHAAFLGLGAYAVGIPVHHAINGEFESIATTNGLFHIPMAVGVCALYALITGAISLRTRGVHFIMITMAFGQMVFFAIVSIETYGGDDGLTIYERSSLPAISLDNPLTLYAVCFVSLLLALYLVHRIVNSRFGMVIRAAKGNEERIRALGFNAYAYRLLAYVISGSMCGYAGALLGNFTTFISPEMMDWTRSGELMFMVILGGAGSLFGPVLGASVFLLLEEVMSDFTIYWHLPFGIMLILAVLFVRGGISGFADRLLGAKRDD
ncbi:MAG: branched-chain amino acid transport system permease protein [Hyphomicrobiaceae bacterium]|jgi:branched-chain amino acid transport system permease protein